jgi:hypothetical protein
MMGWAAGFFGAGGAVLVLGCVIGMGLLMWLLFRLTGDSSNRVGVQPPGHDLDQSLPERLIATDSYPQSRRRPSGHASSGPSGSVAP